MGAGLGSAMVFVLFTYGGWNDAAYISGAVIPVDGGLGMGH